MSEPSASAPLPAASPGPSEGCPTPLDWKEVLEAFRFGRQESQLATSEGDVLAWEYGAGPPLVLLGGAAGTPELFALLAWLLREERRCVLLLPEDLPLIAEPRERLRTWGRLITRAMREFTGPAPVLGALWGGLAGLQAALVEPELVSRLILQGTNIQVHWSTMERLLLACGRGSRRTLKSVPFWSRIAEANHRPWFPPFDAGRWEFLHDNLGRTTVRQFVLRATALNANDVVDQLEAIRRPTLIVRTEGEGARLTRAQETLAARLPLVRTEWMHTTGQYPHVTHPHRLVKLIREFLADDAPPLD